VKNYGAQRRIIYQLGKCIGHNLKAAVHHFMGVICLQRMVFIKNDKKAQHEQ